MQHSATAALDSEELAAPRPRGRSEPRRARSLGPNPIKSDQRAALERLEGELARDGLLPWNDASCADILASDDPCPRARCRHHTFFEIRRVASGEVVALNHPGKDIDEVPETCSIRFARNNPDGATQEEVAVALGCNGQRISQIEIEALAKLRAAGVPDLHRIGLPAKSPASETG